VTKFSPESLKENMLNTSEMKYEDKLTNTAYSVTCPFYILSAKKLIKSHVWRIKFVFIGYNLASLQTFLNSP